MTFKPDNVLLMDNKTGKIPTEQAEIVLKDTISNSAIMQLAQYEEMTKPVKEFSFLAEGPGAYWVEEGKRIQTSKAKWLPAKMEAKKLAVILPVSKESLRYSVKDFFSQMAPEIAEAFIIKFDQAALFGIDTPYAEGMSVKERAEKAGNVVQRGTNETYYEDLNDLIASVEDGDHDPNGFVTTRRNRRLLRGAMDTTGRPIFNDPRQGATATALGLPISYVNGRVADKEKTEIMVGDWDYARYGILQDIEYKIDESATLTTIQDSEGNDINLFERDMLALRATMHIGFITLKEDAFGLMVPEGAEG